MNRLDPRPSTAVLFDTGIPGLRFELPLLRPVIVDDALADEALRREDHPGDAVLLLIAQQRFGDAAERVAEARLLDPSNVRLRLLDTEITRWMGDRDRAISRLRRLQDEFAGTAAEAEVLQQLGADFYARGDLKAAATRFHAAWRGRISADADARLIECSRLCHELVTAQLERGDA